MEIKTITYAYLTWHNSTETNEELSGGKNSLWESHKSTSVSMIENKEIDNILKECSDRDIDRVETVA